MDASSAIVELHAEIERRFEAYTWAGISHDNRASAVESLADELGRHARLEKGCCTR